MQEIEEFFKAINDNKNFCVCFIFFLPLQGIEIKTETMTTNCVIVSKRLFPNDTAEG